MKKQFLLHAIGALLLVGHAAIAAAQSNGDRRVRIQITRNENGNESHVTREFDLNDEQQLADALRELGVMDEMNIIGDDENLVIDLKRMRDGGMLKDMSMALSLADAAGAHTEPRAYLGVYYGNWNAGCDDGDREGKATKNKVPVKEGACVTAVEEGTPAEKAGLKAGDVIVELDGRDVRSGQGLLEAIRDHQPGDEVKLVYYRGKDKKTTKVTLAAKSEEAEATDWNWQWNMDHEDYGRAMDAFADAFRFEEHGAFLGVDGDDEPDGQGVRITNVVDSSAAERMGLKEGDVIRSINGETVTDFDDLVDRMDESKPGDPVAIMIDRDGKKITLNGELGERHAMVWRWNDANGMVAPVPPVPPVPGVAPVPPVQRWQGGDREEMRREMDELREEMNRLRRELRSEVTREMRVTVDAVELSLEESAVLKKKGVPNLERTLELPGLRVAPNPSSGSFNLAFQAPQRGDLNVDVHDANGDRVYHESITGFKGNYERVLDMSDRPAGTYFVVITQNGKAQARKIVKQ